MPQRAPGAGSVVGSINTGSGEQIVRRLEGVQTPIINYVFKTAGSYLRTRYPVITRDKIGVSLGNGGLPVQQTGVSFPQVVSGNQGTTKYTLPHVPIGQTGIQDEGKLPMTSAPRVAADWFEYHEAVAKGIVILPPGSPAPIVAPAPTVTPTKTSTGGSMDLGSIITDLGTAYIKTKYAPTVQPTIQTVSVPSVQPAYSLGDVGSDIIDYFTDPATGTVVPVKKKKPCRRRRRRLATKSDLGDLAALKAILGNGEAFKAWIATHSR